MNSFATVGTRVLEFLFMLNVNLKLLIYFDGDNFRAKNNNSILDFCYIRIIYDRNLFSEFLRFVSD